MSSSLAVRRGDAALAILIERLRRTRRDPVASPLLQVAPLLLLGSCAGRGGIAATPPAARVTVTGASDAIAATAGGGPVTRLTSGAASVVANDSATNTSHAITVSAVTAGTGANATPGTVGQAIAGGLGTLLVNADGSFSFVVADNDAVRALAAGETGVNRFTYTPSVDGVSDAAQTITVTVTGINDPPVAVADVNSVSRFSAAPTVSGNVRANDSDPDDNTTRAQLTITQVAAGGGPAQGLTTPINGTYGSLTLNADGSYAYTIDSARPATAALAPGQTASDVFTYTIADPQGATATTTLTITITGTANAPPTALPDTGSIVTQQPLDFIQGNVRGNDSDSVTPRAQLTVTQVATDTGTTGTIGNGLAGHFGTLVLNADGSYVYTLDHTNPVLATLGPADSRDDVFTYTIADTDGGTASTTLTLHINGAANTPPQALPDVGSIVAQSSPGFVQGNVRANDTDSFTPRALLTVTSAVGADGIAHAPGTGFIGRYGTLALNADGSYVYTIDNSNPATIGLGPGDSRADVFTYTIADQQGATATTTLTVNVTGANDPPVTADDRITFVEDSATTVLTGNLLSQ